MAPTTPPLINSSLQTNEGDGGAAGALASVTLAEKKQGSRAPRGPKVSNNFDSVPTCWNPARGAKLDGGVAESEAAGGSPRKKPQDHLPRKKPRGKETVLRRLDRAKAIAEQGRKEAIKLEEPHGNPKAIRMIGPKAAAPRSLSPRQPPRLSPSHRRSKELSILTRMRRSSTTRTSRTMMASRMALQLATKWRTRTRGAPRTTSRYKPVWRLHGNQGAIRLQTS